MKISKLNNIYQITIFPRLFPVNCYIVEEHNELTLIDTGLSISYKGIVKVAKEINKPLTNIILTHAHGDHVGSLDRLRGYFPETCISISSRDSRLLKGDTSLDAKEPQTPIKGDIPKKIKTVPDLLLKEGDIIGSLEIIETPGHTPGSISLFNRKTGAIIAGDAFQTQNKVAVCGQFVPLFPFPSFATWNKEESLKSARKILSLEPSILAVGHGEMIENPVIIMKQAIYQAENNLVNV